MIISVLAIILPTWNSLAKNKCHWTNCKTKIKWKNQNLGIIVPVSLGSNRAILTLKKVCPLSLGINRISLTWEQSCQCYSGIIVPVSLGNNCASLISGPLRQTHWGAIASLSLGNNRASLTWEKLCQSTWKQFFQPRLGTIAPVSPQNKHASLT